MRLVRCCSFSIAGKQYTVDTGAQPTAYQPVVAELHQREKNFTDAQYHIGSYIFVTIIPVTKMIPGRSCQMGFVQTDM